MSQVDGPTVRLRNKFSLSVLKNKFLLDDLLLKGGKKDSVKNTVQCVEFMKYIMMVGNEKKRSNENYRKQNECGGNDLRWII